MLCIKGLKRGIWKIESRITTINEILIRGEDIIERLILVTMIVIMGYKFLILQINVLSLY